MDVLGTWQVRLCRCQEPDARQDEQAKQQEGAEGGRWLKCPTLVQALAQAPDVARNGIVQAGKVVVEWDE